jgi:hypothetical protein
MICPGETYVAVWKMAFLPNLSTSVLDRTFWTGSDLSRGLTTHIMYISTKKACMTADVRSMAGLGYPPTPYTQNANECIYSLIKRECGKMPMTEFCQKLETVVKRQQEQMAMTQRKPCNDWTMFNTSAKTLPVILPTTRLHALISRIRTYQEC